MVDGAGAVFRAPARDADAEFTEKRSRFIGSVRALLSAEAAGEILKRFPREYPGANHHCWAYRLGVGTVLEHCSDAGEPSGTAGRPILGAIKKHGITNTLVVVTRYFGGIKLGVRGLIDAYKEAAELAIAKAGVAEMELCNALRLRCGYDYSKTLLFALRKLGFADGRVEVEYGADVVVRLEAPLSQRAVLEAAISEPARRSLVTEVVWDDAPLVRERVLK